MHAHEVSIEMKRNYFSAVKKEREQKPEVNQFLIEEQKRWKKIEERDVEKNKQVTTSGGN